MKIRKEWKSDELDFLFACIETGWLHKDIANELDRSTSAISHKINRLEIKEPKNKKLTNEIVYERLKGRNIRCIENYINSYTKIEFECLICNNIWKSKPAQVLNADTGCPYCAGNLRLNNEKVDERLKNRDINRIGNYINNHTKIEFLCLKCNNKWHSKTKDIFRNHGCPFCKLSSFKIDIPAVTYCIYFKELDLYKVGISNNYIKRFKNFGYVPEIIFLRDFELGEDALTLESQWLQNIHDYKINTGKLISGNTETFRYEAII